MPELQPTDVNHAYAQWAAHEVRHRYRAAMDAMLALGDVLLDVQKGDYRGTVPQATFADVLFDSDEMPLSVPHDASWLIADVASRAASLIEHTTGVGPSKPCQCGQRGCPWGNTPDWWVEFVRHHTGGEDGDAR